LVANPGILAEDQEKTHDGLCYTSAFFPTAKVVGENGSGNLVHFNLGCVKIT
jgi:hypothetical protein